MSIIDKNFVYSHITNNYETKRDTGAQTLTPVPYRWTHGATDYHLGDGLIVYSLIQNMRYKTCVCLGSGGGFIPRIMTQARLDLYDQNIFEGNNDRNWGDIGATYLVDAANGVGGVVDYLEEDSFFQSVFKPRFIKETTKNAFYNFFVKQEIKIDYLHIDAGHSYDDVKQDFELYSTILSHNGLISIHDTDLDYHDSLIISEDQKNHYELFDGPSKFIKEITADWNIINLFNSGQILNKPSSTGLTLLQKKLQ